MKRCLIIIFTIGFSCSVFSQHFIVPQECFLSTGSLKNIELPKKNVELIKWHADFILTCIFPDGAINQHPLKRKEVWIVPYFSHFACIGLLRAYEILKDEKYLTAAKKWLEWYANHMNEDGTVNDYIGGWYPNYVNTNDYDSADSYAALFAYCVLEYYRITNDKAFLDKIFPKVELSFKAIKDVLQPDGLTFAKKHFKIKYLMDNAEVVVGLISYAKIYHIIGKKEEAQKFLQLADQTINSIKENYYNPQTGFYAAEMNMIGDKLSRMEFWFPDALSNILLLRFLALPTTDSEKFFLKLYEKSKELKEPPKGRDAYQYLWWADTAAKFGKHHIVEKFLKLYEKEMGSLKEGNNDYLISMISGHIIRLLSYQLNPIYWWW